MDVRVNTGPLHRTLVWIAGGALLVAMVTDTMAMLGRQLHWPLLGSIEIVQTAVLISSAGALLVSTGMRMHARVHLLLDRLPARMQVLLEVVHILCACALILALLIGSTWIASDLWRGHEESELLRIPYRPLRVVVVLTLLSLLPILLRQLWRRRAP